MLQYLHLVQKPLVELVNAGIIGILNFAPANLQVPQGVFVQDVDIAASLAVLSTKVKTVLENK